MYFRKILYCTIILSIGLTFTRIAHADPTNIITMYINNSGIHATVGINSETTPELKLSMDQSTEPTLTGEPPSLFFKSSPLKFFNRFWATYGGSIRHLLNNDDRKTLPTKIHIAAAGAEMAVEQDTPKREEVAHFLALYPQEEGDKCLQAKNKKGFFQCIFLLETKKWLPRQSNITVEIEHDINLMAAIASLYHDREKSKLDYNTEAATPKEKSAVLMGHVSTFLNLYEIPDTQSQQCYKINAKTIVHPAASHQLGTLFKDKHAIPCLNHATMKPVVESFDQQKILRSKGELYEIRVDQSQFEECFKQYNQENQDDLLSAVYSCKFLHEVVHTEPGKTDPRYRGAPYMICRLVKSKVGNNLFGDIVETIFCSKDDPAAADNFLQCVPYSRDTAHQQVKSLMDELTQSALDVIFMTSYHYTWQQHKEHEPSLPNTGRKKPLPTLILVGEKTHFFEHYAQQEQTSFAAILQKRLEDKDYINNLASRVPSAALFTVGTLGIQQNLIETVMSNTKHLIENMVMIPSAEFPDLMHQAVLKNYL